MIIYFVNIKYFDAFFTYNYSIALTKLDILDVLPEIKVGVAYRLNGKELNHFPTSTAELGAVEVDYITLPGWMTSTESVRTFDDLPENARKYVELIEDKLGLPGKYNIVYNFCYWNETYDLFFICSSMDRSRQR